MPEGGRLVYLFPFLCSAHRLLTFIPFRHRGKGTKVTSYAELDFDKMEEIAAERGAAL